MFQKEIEEILSSQEIFGQHDGRFWGFDLPVEKKTRVLEKLRAIGVTFHTLEDHIHFLRSQYSHRPIKLGTPAYVLLPKNGRWFSFENSNRSWKPLYTFGGSETSANVKIGMILKCMHRTGDSYYITHNKNDGSCGITEIRKRAAYNILASSYEPTVAYWIPYQNRFAVIKRGDIKNIPDDIFETLVRLRPVASYFEGYLIFDVRDFTLVQTILSSIRTRVEERTSGDVPEIEVIDEEQILRLKDIDNSRIELFMIILGPLGIHVEKKLEGLLIKCDSKSIEVVIMKNGSNLNRKGILYVSYSVLTDPSRFIELLNSLQSILGLKRINVSHEVFQNWPMLEAEDTKHIVQYVTYNWYANKEKSLRLVDDTKKLEVLKNWMNEIRSGKIRAESEQVAIIEKILKSRQRNS